MDITAYITGHYLAQADVPEPVNVKIASVTETEFEGKTKLVLHAGDLKPMVLNKINLQRLAKIFRSYDTEDWKGKAICIYTDPMIEMQGKIVGGLRIRPAAAPEPKPAPVIEPDDFDEDIPF